MERSPKGIIGFKDWRLKYIGRSVSARFGKEFSDKIDECQINEFVGVKKMRWYDQPKRPQSLDDYWNLHYLKVELYDAGPLKGCIKQILPFHTCYWHTDSNWQDHSESDYWEHRDPNAKEIASYEKILDVCTVDESKQIVTSWFKAIASKVPGCSFDGRFDAPDIWGLRPEDLSWYVYPSYHYIDYFFSPSLFWSKSCAWFFAKINVVEFYKKRGIDIELMKRNYVDRLVEQCGAYYEMAGIERDDAWRSCMNMLESKINAKDRTFIVDACVE